MNFRFATLAILMTFAAGMLPTNARAEQLPQGIKKITTVEGITEYQMTNGLKVLLFPDQSKPRFTVNITYHVGSRHEGRGEAGMAHLLEHMVFKGTPRYPSIWGALEQHGANFNGTTWLDRTNYFETLPATEKNLEFALQMEADRMVNSNIAAEELAKEMTVVRNEFEQGENSPSAVLSERMMSAAFLWHNYGKSTIGNRSDIERVPVTNLRKFYEKYYQPDNATLVVAGKFDPEQTLALIDKYFGSIPKPERELDATYTEEPAQDGPRMVTLKRVGDVPVVGLIYHIPAGPHVDFPAADLVTGILTHQPSGRLYRRLVASGMATSVSGYAFALAEPGVVEFSAEVAEGHEPDAVLATMMEVIEGVGEQGVSKNDVERAIAREMKAFKLAMTNSGRVGVRLSESIAQGDWRLLFVNRDRIGNVTAEDARRVAGTYFIESNRTAGMFIPTKEPARATLPSRPDVKELVYGYKGRDKIAEGEELKSDVGYLESKVVRKTLPSGIKIAMLPIETRGDAVRATLKLHYGDESAFVGKVAADDMISSMLMRGTKEKDYGQLRDAIDALASRISVSGSMTSQGELNGRIQSDRENVLAAIELLAEIMQQPAFDKEEFSIIQKRMSNEIEQGMSDPQTLGFLELMRRMNPWPASSVHYVPTLEEELQNIQTLTIGDVSDLYHQLIGASNMEVAVVGDFDVDAVTQTIEKEFGSWKSPAPYARIQKPHRPVAADNVTIDTPDKEMALVMKATSVQMDDKDPRYPAMVIASYVFGGNPSSRLMTRLRHKGGLSYGANGNFRASSQDERATLMAMAICAPQNAEKAMAALDDEMKNWISDGITEEELLEAKTSYGLKYQSRLAGEGYLLGQLVSGLELDRTLQFQQDIVDRVMELTTEDVQKAVNSVLSEASMISIRAGDPNPRTEAPNSTGQTTDSARTAPASGEMKDRSVAKQARTQTRNPWLQIKQFDKNEDGKVELNELPEETQPFFSKMDVDGNGVVEQVDFSRAG